MKKPTKRARLSPRPRAKAAPKLEALHRPIHRTWPSPWRELIDAYGSTQALADAIGVTPMTIGRWADGLSTPSIPAQKWINLEAAKLGLRPPF